MRVSKVDNSFELFQFRENSIESIRTFVNNDGITIATVTEFEIENSIIPPGLGDTVLADEVYRMTSQQNGSELIIITISLRPNPNNPLYRPTMRPAWRLYGSAQRRYNV